MISIDELAKMRNSDPNKNTFRFTIWKYSTYGSIEYSVELASKVGVTGYVTYLGDHGSAKFVASDDVNDPTYCKNTVSDVIDKLDQLFKLGKYA